MARLNGSLDLDRATLNILGQSQREAVGLSVGKAGTIPATSADTGDFLLAIPFDMTAERLKVTRKTHGSAAMVIQPRVSGDAGNSYSDALESITFGSTSLEQELNITDVDLNEGDILNFSITSGGGTNLLVEVIGRTR